jgi:hypothetical protein
VPVAGTVSIFVHCTESVVFKHLGSPVAIMSKKVTALPTCRHSFRTISLLPPLRPTLRPPVILSLPPRSSREGGVDDRSEMAAILECTNEHWPFLQISIADVPCRLRLVWPIPPASTMTTRPQSQRSRKAEVRSPKVIPMPWSFYCSSKSSCTNKGRPKVVMFI